MTKTRRKRREGKVLSPDSERSFRVVINIRNKP